MSTQASSSGLSSSSTTLASAAPAEAMSPRAMQQGPVYPDWWIEAEFDGAGNGWTNISRDVRVAEPIRWSWGIQGSGPTDRVSSTGTLSFGLDNSEANSAGQIGYYSPDSPSVRPGFGLGIGVRIAWSSSGVVKYKKYYLDQIIPMPGEYLQRLTLCQCADLVDDFARQQLLTLGVQVNKRSDEIFDAIVAVLSKAPANTSSTTGQDSYAYALDTGRSEGDTVLSAFQKLAQSEYGQIVLKGDATDGETLVFEDRHVRTKNQTNAYTFYGETDRLELVRSRRELRNVIRVITHQRRVDDTPTTVLFRLTDAQPQIDAGQTITIFGSYRDPDQEAFRVGGIDMVTPVATTDYIMVDAGGGDLTGDLGIVANFGAQGVQFVLTNNASVKGNITKLQCRGRGLYDYTRPIMEASDTTSITTYGERMFVLDLPYQDDSTVGQNLATYILGLYKDPISLVSMGYTANLRRTLMDQAVALDISDRIGLSEKVTGVSPHQTGSDFTTGWYINGVNMELIDGQVLRVEYALSPQIVGQAQWILEQSRLDQDAVLVLV